MSFDEGEGTVLFQPLSHIMGAGMMLGTLACGAYCVIMSRFDPITYLELVVKHRASPQDPFVILSFIL